MWSPCLTIRFAIVLMCLLLTYQIPIAFAHPELSTSVRHRSSIVVGPKNVDVTIELTIGEIPSFAERLLMDENQDGNISVGEVDTYLDEQTETLQQSASLLINGEPLDLFFLYDPEIELGAVDTTTPAHLVIRLFYFARTPSDLKAGDDITLEDRLWLHMPSLGSFDVEGREGFELLAEKKASTLWTTLDDKKPLVMHARLLSVAEGAKQKAEVNSEEKMDSLTDTKPAANDITSNNQSLRDTVDPNGSKRTLQYSRNWLFSLGIVAFVVCTVAVLTRRNYRLKKDHQQ